MPSSLAEIQSRFAAALADPEEPVPEGVVGRDGSLDVRRFSVHRNTIMVGLVEALEQRFPVSRRLVGDEFFRAMAHVYATEHKPRTPLMMFYGETFPTFAAGFEPAGSVPYLADVARLELAWSHAYHAPEAEPLAADALHELSPATLAGSTLTMHPSLRMVRSPHPVGSVWSMHQDGVDIRPLDHWECEDVLILRAHADVAVRCLPPGGYAFITALAAGKAVERSAEAALAEDRLFDLGHNVVGLFRVGGVIQITSPDQDKATP